MKKLAMAVILSAVVSGATLAQSANNGWYVGAGLTQVQATKLEPKNFTVSVGYHFANSFGVEYQYSGSYKEDSFENGSFIVDGVHYEGFEFQSSLNTSAVFATYVYGDSFYGKVKAGFMKAEYTSEFESTQLNTISVDSLQNGWAAGVGAGYNFTDNSAVEVEYLTTADKIDINFLTFGYKYSF